MNDYNNASKKRKKSFANDRLKRLRTSLGDDVVTLPSKNISRRELTPSVKNDIQNNPEGYPERKKLVAARKLKTNANESNLKSTNRLEHSIDTVNIGEKSTLSDYVCTPKRQKVGVFGAKCNSLEKTFSGNMPTSSRNASTVSRQENKESSIQNSVRKIEKSIPAISTPSICNDKTPRRYSQSAEGANESPVNSQLAKLKSIVSTNFSDICSVNSKFKQSNVQIVPVSVKPNAPINVKSKAPVNKKSNNIAEHSCSLINSKNYMEYFGQAMNSLYSKLFGSHGNVGNQPEIEVADSDSMDWEPGDVEFLSNIPEHGKKESDREMYIIVDTNIFLDSLRFLEGIVNYGSNGGIKSVIYVPWMVFNELDFIKDNKTSNMKPKACKAIDFINKMLTNKDKKLIGQSIFEANKQMYVGKSPDDKITSCCLQVKEKGYNTVLLSNDKNLRNKLIINGIPSLSCSDLLNNFNDIPPTTANSDETATLLDEMSKCCTSIIKDCCEEAYGSVWDKLALLDKQPWSFLICLEILRKYWSAVFREKLLKQCLKIVEKMISVLKLDSLKNSETFESFAKDCLSLCFFLMDLEQHKDIIEETIKKINSMVEQNS